MTKSISISDNAYGDLLSIKREGESFSEVILRVAGKEKKKSLLEFAGTWVGSKDETDVIFKAIFNERHKSKLREF